MMLSPLEDLAAICTAETPEQLWRHLAVYPTLRAQWNDFDVWLAFRTLHGGRGTHGAERTAALLCTDPRWRRVTATLIAHIEDSGILTDTDLDALAEEFLWQDRLAWPVPHAWLGDGLVVVLGRRRRRGPVVLERLIPVPLRRWAAARIAARDPRRTMDVLERIVGLDARAGDAVMTGLLDVCDRFPDEARAELVELGCAWGNGTVRLRALELLAAYAPELAADRAVGDPSNSVRSRAGRLRMVRTDSGATPVDRPAPAADGDDEGSPQLALFG